MVGSLRAWTSWLKSVNTLVLTQAVPAELVIATCATHVRATTILADWYMTCWARLGVLADPLGRANLVVHHLEGLLSTRHALVSLLLTLGAELVTTAIALGTMAHASEETAIAATWAPAEVWHFGKSTLQKELVHTISSTLAKHSLNVIHTDWEIAVRVRAPWTGDSIAVSVEPLSKAVLAESMVTTTQRNQLGLLHADHASAIYLLTRNRLEHQSRVHIISSAALQKDTKRAPERI